MNSVTKVCANLCVAGAVLFGTAAAANDFLLDEPNLQPTSNLFMVYVASADSASWSIDTHVASHAARERRGDDVALFDGETSRVRLKAHYQVNDAWRLGIDSSYFWLNKGALDPFIDSWHKVFGLPEGIRDERPRDVLDFTVDEAGNSLIAVGSRQRGIGDTRVFAHYQMRPTGPLDGKITLSAAVKLPTGDATRLTGSGGTDIGVGVDWRSIETPQSRWQWSAGGGAVLIGDSEIENLAEQDVVFSGQLSASYRVTANFRLGARLQGHSSVLDSRLDNIGAPAIQLITGGEWRFSKDWALRITVAEDIAVEHSPDVTFRIGLARGY